MVHTFEEGGVHRERSCGGECRCGCLWIRSSSTTHYTVFYGCSTPTNTALRRGSSTQEPRRSGIRGWQHQGQLPRNRLKKQPHFCPVTVCSWRAVRILKKVLVQTGSVLLISLDCCINLSALQCSTTPSSRSSPSLPSSIPPFLTASVFSTSLHSTAIPEHCNETREQLWERRYGSNTATCVGSHRALTNMPRSAHIIKDTWSDEAGE